MTTTTMLLRRVREKFISSLALVRAKANSNAFVLLLLLPPPPLARNTSRALSSVPLAFLSDSSQTILPFCFGFVMQREREREREREETPPEQLASRFLGNKNRCFFRFAFVPHLKKEKEEELRCDLAKESRTISPRIDRSSL